MSVFSAVYCMNRRGCHMSVFMAVPVQPRQETFKGFCKPQLSHKPHTALELDQYFFHGDASIYLQPHTAQRQPCNHQETFVLHLLHTLLNMNLMTNIGFDIRQPIIQQLGTLENVTSRYNQPSLDFIGQEFHLLENLLKSLLLHQRRGGGEVFHVSEHHSH